MKIFVSSTRIGQPGSVADRLVALLRERGAVVSHSPPDYTNAPANDTRLVAWQDWYTGGCAEAVSGADAFVAIVDDWYGSSTWMAAELDAARGSKGAGRLFWFASLDAGGAQHLPAWWAVALRQRLPDDITAAVEVILAQGTAGSPVEAAT